MSNLEILLIATAASFFFVCLGLHIFLLNKLPALNREAILLLAISSVVAAASLIFKTGDLAIYLQFARGALMLWMVAYCIRSIRNPT